MEKLKRLQAGEDIEELLAEIDDEMPSQDEEELEDEDYDTVGLTEVQKKVTIFSLSLSSFFYGKIMLGDLLDEGEPSR